MEITLALAQYPITRFRSFLEWQEHAESWVKQAADKGAQLAVFPEYGAMELTSLLPDAVCSDLQLSIREMQVFYEDFQKHFTELSRKYALILVAPSFPVRVENRYVNRSLVCSPSGKVSCQDKLFMTRFENEEWKIAPGEEVLRIFQTPVVTFGIQICYDGEFSAGSHLLAQNGAQIILFPSCTETIRGAARVHVGARARALEQQCFTGVAQTIGEALWSPSVDRNYGYAALYCTPDKDLPPLGIIAEHEPQKPGWLVQKLDLDKVKSVREEGQVFNYRDHSKLTFLLNGKTIRTEKVEMK